ncbi:unnamed protein product, partial [Effrenium voratum]
APPSPAMAAWAALLACHVAGFGVIAVDWVAWKDGKSQGLPGPSWKPVSWSDRFQQMPWEVPGKPNAYRNFFPGATHYTLGTAGPEFVNLEVWQPFSESPPDSAVCANIRGALLNLYRNQLHRVAVTIRNVGWNGVGTKKICEPNQGCPTVMLLGASQFPQRVFADRALPLNHFMQEYLQTKLMRLQDDFPSVAFYQYLFDSNWMGIPFMTDVRLIAFNRTTFENLKLPLPPPYGRHWSWQSAFDAACRIKDEYGVPGLLANADYAEDFKFFTLMVQSKGSALYRVSGEGDSRVAKSGLGSEQAKDVMENFWMPIISRGCLRAHDGGAYWKGVEPPSAELIDKILDPETINPMHPPRVANFSNYRYRLADGKRAVVYGLVLASRGSMVVKDDDDCKYQMLLAEVDSFRLSDSNLCEVYLCGTGRAVARLFNMSKNTTVYSEHCSEIMYASMPDKRTYQGGSALMMPKFVGQFPMCHNYAGRKDEACREQREGWEIIMELTDIHKPWISQANLMKEQSLPPPRQSLSQSLAKNWIWKPVVDALDMGIPSQYPNVPIPASSQLEDLNPIRIALLRRIYGNVSSQRARQEASSIIDELVRPCNASRWKNDPRCQNPLDGDPGCFAGQKLISDDLGTILCEHCSAGQFREERSVDQACEPCPLGRFSSSVGSSSCEQCPEGLVASITGATACFGCLPGQAPMDKTCRDCLAGTYQDSGLCMPCPSGYTSPPKSAAKEHCMPKPVLIWVNLAILVLVLSLAFLLPFALGRPTPIADVYLNGGRLALKTWGAHRVSRHQLLPVKVRLQNTGHYLLDGHIFRVQRQDEDVVWLLDSEGQHISTDINSSMGTMRILPCCTLWGVSFGRLPLLPVLLLKILPLILVLAWAAGNAEAEAMHLRWLLPTCIFGIIAVLCCSYYAWRTLLTETPLARRLRSFRETLLKANPAPRVTPRGPSRAIAADQIQDLLDTFRDFIGHRNMHYVANNLLLPLTEAHRLSYAELVGPCQVQWFVSHCWNNAFADFVRALQKVAIGTHPREGVSFWICTFSNNQWQVQAELGDGDPLSSSFFLALQSPGCRGTAMVLDQNCEPLRRSWCLFELLQTHFVSDSSERVGYQGLLLCTPAGILQWGNADVDTVLKLAEKMGSIRLEDAQATRPEDKAMIDRCVEQTVPGGFAEVNQFARESIRTVLDQANCSFQSRIKDLMSTLEVGTFPRLLGRRPEGSPSKKSDVAVTL